MPVKFAVKIVRLNVYMTFASPTTLTFIQSHKCVSNWTGLLFNLQYIGQYLSYYIQTWNDGRRMHNVHARFDELTLTLMQGHSGSAKAKNQHCMLSATKPAASSKLSYNGRPLHFCLLHDLDFANIHMA